MPDRTLRTATTTLVLAIAGIAFLVSFDAISTYAVRTGAFPPVLGWCAPLLVDSFTLAACLVILARSRDGARARYAWSLVMVSSAVSVALNVAHAPAHPSARLVAALPPAALLASVELVMSEARRLRALRSAAPVPALPALPESEPHDQAHEPAALIEPEDGPAVPTGEPAAAGVRSSRAMVRELCATALRDGGRVTVERVMKTTGLKRRRAYELLAEVRGELRVA